MKTIIPITVPVMVPVLIFLCCACRTIKYVPVETTLTEYRHTITTVSVHLHDSIMVKQKGDTVFLEKYRYS
jgi:hypothetical protein